MIITTLQQEGQTLRNWLKNWEVSPVYAHSINALEEDRLSLMRRLNMVLVDLDKANAEKNWLVQKIQDTGREIEILN